MISKIVRFDVNPDYEGVDTVESVIKAKNICEHGFITGTNQIWIGIRTKLNVIDSLTNVEIIGLAGEHRELFEPLEKHSDKLRLMSFAQQVHENVQQYIKSYFPEQYIEAIIVKPEIERTANIFIDLFQEDEIYPLD